jgi:hypothetical protein
MSQQIQAERTEGGTVGLQYDNPPEECPICHTAILPKLVAAALTGDMDGGCLQVVCRCTKRICDRLFIATYHQRIDEDSSSTSGVYYFKRSLPTNPRKEDFGDLIKSVSGSFVKIFNQAVAAEVIELDEVAGIGFRKALEFLIKDFAIHQKPKDAERIKSTPLATCINNYIDDPRLKKCAEKATWLGNDESHYVRKWKHKDVTDLKVLIKLSVNWIENVLLTESYDKEMPNTSSKKGSEK